MSIFPLIRHLSARCTPMLARLPLSANQITFLSLLFGIAASWSILQGTRVWHLAGAAELVICYVLDNCDGEIARLTNQCSRIGDFFDTIVDWLVHAGFFLALGFAVQAATGNDIWLWLGVLAAGGCTINYVIGLIQEARAREPGSGETASAETADNPGEKPPAKFSEKLVYVFRELFRADFCFIVLGVAVFDLTWVLLPMGAAGAQVYWMMRFVARAKNIHA